MAAHATADSSSIDEENRCVIHFSTVGDQDLKAFSGITWPKVLAAAEIWSKTDGEKGEIAQDFLAFANAHSRNSEACTSDTLPIPTQARFHRPCYSKFTDKSKLKQDHGKRKRPQDTENDEFDGKFCIEM